MLRLRVKLRPGSKLPAVSAVLDRARSRIPRAELRNLVMGDPGTGDYVAAYGRVLDGGVGALLEEQRDGVPLIHSFDITENLLLAHSCAGESVHHRWFSVMAACIELLGAADVTYAPFSQSLAGLLVDTFALNDARAEGAPLDLMPLACRELKTSASAPSEAMLALVGELCTALRTEAETEATCRELSALHDTSQAWYAPSGEPNLFYSPRPEFVWGPVVGNLREYWFSRGGLPLWLDVVRRRFPTQPELANETRERLLRDGEALLKLPRRQRR